MNDCKEIRERLSAFIDNELPPHESRVIKSHLHQCPACAHEESSLRQVIDLLDGIPDESPSVSFSRAALHRAASWKRCVYVKDHLLKPALTTLDSVFTFILSIVNSPGQSPRHGYLQDFDDFPPDSLSNIYMRFIEGEAR